MRDDIGVNALNYRFFTCTLFLLLSLIGCDSARDTAPAPVEPPPVAAPASLTLFVDPVDAVLVETATQALPTWRQYIENKPALILFSNDPFLDSVPAPLYDQAMELVRNGSQAQINARAVDISPNPLLMHGMAVDAALKAGLFSEIVWILPSESNAPLPPLDIFKQKLLKAKVATPEETESFARKGNVYTGILRGKPVTFGNLSAIPRPGAPAWVHFDLSFFKPLYTNEVNTPLYPLILNTLKTIRAAGMECIGASISHSNLGGEISLKVRFIGKDLAYLMGNPASLDKGLPELQLRRSQNLYLEQFIKKDDILANCQQMEKLAPDDATVKFDLYNAYREVKKGNLALDALRQAVLIDPMYAYEYIFLAEIALEKGRPDSALEMLDLARKIFPGNPTIPLLEANIQIILGQRAKALALVDQLKQLPWSTIYDPDMPARLKRLEQAALALPSQNRG